MGRQREGLSQDGQASVSFGTVRGFLQVELRLGLRIEAGEQDWSQSIMGPERCAKESGPILSPVSQFSSVFYHPLIA